jgi:cob(I)alamin adenosyltransferase
VKVYTRTGDDGTTGLFYGGRIGKSDVGPTAYGTVDEAVSAIGVARAAARDARRGEELHDLLVRLQRELFVVGAELATAPHNRHKLDDGTTRSTEAMVTALEPIIDDVTARFEAPTEFVLPGEDFVGATLDLARTVVRRAERDAVEAVRVEWLDASSQVVPYLNRLADLLWVLARWQEGASRKLRTGEI